MMANMQEIQGMLAIDELKLRVSEGTIDTVIVAFTDHYGRLMGKRYDATFFLEDTVTGGSHACDYLLTVDRDMNPLPGFRFANWERGYGDVHLVPDMSTLRTVSWLDRTALVICDVHPSGGHELLPIAPRSILRHQVQRAAASKFTAMAATELEFYMFRDSFEEAARKGHADLKPTGWYIEDYHILQGTRGEDYVGALRRHLASSGVPVENSKGEWGHGQHELNVRYAEILEMADRHVIYKQCAKEVAHSQGRSVTFMAKIDEGEAGSSCHVHLSLWQDGKNAFAGEQDLAGIACSDAFRWFLGGWIKHAPEIMVFFAPTVNSYKRYQAASWAPTRLAWSYDNRTAGFRVVGSGKSLRIECRIPGADCNPYLALAACLAAGLEGIESRIEPPPVFEGDVYAATDLPAIPTSLDRATELFSNSEFCRSAFGEEVVEHYTHFLRSEWAAYEKAVTDWERNRYFDHI
jgi:glutamine synthetase